MNLPTILALDFDGVICDGLREYFQTSKLTYNKIWLPDDDASIDDLALSFCRLRPVIETGWEMPVLLRSLVLGISEENICQNWSKIAEQIIESEGLDKKAIAKTLDSVRDDWIQEDLASWLSLHRFYPGIIEQLARILQSPTHLYIVTTKERRFVKQLLKNQGLDFPESAIFGKAVKRPKYETLRTLLNTHAETPANLWFVEDLLQPLQLVQQQTDLQGVKLYLADWGYNTQQTRDTIRNNPSIHLLSLQKFSQDLATWH